MKAYTALEDLEQDLGFPAKTLYGLSNNLDKHYRNTFIPKHDGSKRKLSVPDTILKKVQRSISDNILSHYTISRYATAYTAGSSVQKNASLHVGKQKILKLDIDGFFDHITYSKVKDIVFCKENYSEQIRILLTMLCYYKESLPQGAPTSPAITNIIMYDFDEKIGKYCAENNISYTRYCDDMTFSGDFDEKLVIAFVKDELRKLGLFLKKRKTAVIKNTKRQTVMGIVVNEKIGLTKDYKNKIRQEIYYIKKYGLDGHLSKISEPNKQHYLNSLKGRVAFVVQTIPDYEEFLGYKEFLKNMQK